MRHEDGDGTGAKLKWKPIYKFLPKFCNIFFVSRFQNYKEHIGRNKLKMSHLVNRPD